MLRRFGQPRDSSNEFIRASRQFLPSLETITARQTKPDLAVPRPNNATWWLAT